MDTIPADTVETPPLIKLIRGWVDACDNQHDCLKNPQPTDRNPTWVIDTYQKCILPGDQAGRYLALSYVWSENWGITQQIGAQPLQLDRARLLHFQTPGSLGDPSNPFPKPIRDAIKLTRRIGERYLWVDRICIVQDADDTTTEVMKMDQIYSNAYLTIISGETDGLYPQSTLLPEYTLWTYEPQCISGLCTWRTPNQTDACCSTADYVKHQIKCLNMRLSISRWATRGWTYQEQILSRRSIIFLDDLIFWECDQSVWDGHKLSPENDGPSTSEASEMGRRLLTLQRPDFSLYIDLVCFYNNRKFSYPEDALVAISGIFNTIGPVYPGGFIGGLPSIFLDCSLLWQPYRKGTRRVSRSNSSDISTFGLPSWSWCGWQCLVDPWSLRSGLSDINAENQRELAGTWKTHNLVTWSMTTPSEDERTIHEPSKCDQQVDKTFCGRTCDISPEWSERDMAKIGSSDASAAVFSHNGDDNTSSKHPIPPNEALLSDNINSTARLLSCTTTRAFFRPAAVVQAITRGCYLGVPKISAFDHPMFKECPKEDQATPVMVLQDMSGRRSGMLRLMDDEEDYDRLGQIELIAISKGSCSVKDLTECFEQRAFDGWLTWPGSVEFLVFRATWLHETLRSDAESDVFGTRLPSSLRQSSVTYGIDETCHFYNVLWIERKNGIAYRRACGRILKPIWEQNVCGNTEITLG